MLSYTFPSKNINIKSYRTVYYLVVSTDVKFVVSSEGYKKRVENMGNILILVFSLLQIMRQLSSKHVEM